MNEFSKTKPTAETGQVTTADAPKETAPSREEAEAAVATLIRWIGDNPEREGLIDTPSRVIRAYEELFVGYTQDPMDILNTTFDEAGGYDEIIALTNIQINSHCEHHILPITGQVHVAYLPNQKVLGLSKLARLVDVFAKRLQIQERLTAQIADTIQEALQPRGVAVVVEATHQCMTMRGVKKQGGIMKTSRMIGAFRDDPETRREFYAMIDRGRD
ncbi:MAG: GTP cyclohydrolase I FolE [Alphaproteobacteria bacterium]|nr:GTP cyclohydrolase I FolE [Alphaproteobacteria bacterium SS10]